MGIWGLGDWGKAGGEAEDTAEGKAGKDRDMGI